MSQSQQQIRITHRLNRHYGLNSVGSTGDSTPDDPTKSNSSVGAVVQRGNKTNCTEHRLNRRWWTSIRRCNEQKQHGERASPVEPMIVELKHRCNQAESPKTLKCEKPTHRLNRRNISQASVYPVIGKSLPVPRNYFSSPRPLEILMIVGSNQVQRSSNFGEMKMMTSRTHPQNISTKVLTD